MTFHRIRDDLLAETCTPRSGKTYQHTAQLVTFVEVVHAVDAEPRDFVLESIVEITCKPSSQVALCLRFLTEFGLIEKVHGRANRRTEDSIYLSAMTAWYGLEHVEWIRHPDGECEYPSCSCHADAKAKEVQP